MSIKTGLTYRLRQAGMVETAERIEEVAAELQSICDFAEQTVDGDGWNAVSCTTAKDREQYRCTCAVRWGDSTHSRGCPQRKDFE